MKLVVAAQVGRCPLLVPSPLPDEYSPRVLTPCGVSRETLVSESVAYDPPSRNPSQPCFTGNFTGSTQHVSAARTRFLAAVCRQRFTGNTATACYRYPMRGTIPSFIAYKQYGQPVRLRHALCRRILWEARPQETELHVKRGIGPSR